MIQRDALAQAAADAHAAISAAGVVVEMLEEVEAVDALADLLVEIWGAPEPLISGDLLRAMSKAGSYVAGAYAEGRLVGGCIGFHEAPHQRVLHSHIAGVMRGRIGHGVGYALKLHQRSWALERGIGAIEWTYDPLIARNAHFNIVKLGARPREYLTNFYGRMRDAINGGEDSDRILVRWELLSPEASAACRGVPLAVPVASPGAVHVALPTDIEGLRTTDPEEARAWRTRVRDELAPRLADGWRVVGFDRTTGYHLEPPPLTSTDQMETAR